MNTNVVDVDLSTLPLSGDGVLAQLNRLREHDPLYWSERSRCWIVTGHSQVMEGFSGTLPLSSTHLPASLYRSMPPDVMQTRMPNMLRYMTRMITNLDGQDHARIRKLLVKAFTRKLVEDLRPFVRDRVSMLLDRAAAQRDLEFHEGMSRQLPGHVILKLLGLTEQVSLETLKRWADTVTLALTSFNPKVEWLDALEAMLVESNEVFRLAIEDRRRNPKPDLITELVNAVDSGDRLTMDEMLGAMNLIIVAGHDTTANSMTLGVRALARHPDAWAQWRAHPERSLDESIELMRYVAMSTALPRIVSQDFDWQGRKLRKGDLLMLFIAGGNRDPHVFGDAEKIDFGRQNDAALTFGPGLHHCIGHMLAKMQMSEYFGALTQRFEHVEILEEPAFVPNLVFRGVQSLKVRFHPRPAH